MLQKKDFKTQEPPLIVLGMMSGTSLDGLDLALCRFPKTGEYEFLLAETIKYPIDWERKLRTAHELNAEELLKLNYTYGLYCGTAARTFIKKSGISGPVLIASHGHTVYHNPADGFSFQLGNGAAIMAESGCNVVCDFRNADIALGGQGAPLVPFGDRILFGAYDACINLGGFANISFESNKLRLAGDIGPCNFILNHYVTQRNLAYDPDGSHAASGALVEPLIEKLNNMEYYFREFPKSLGREWVQRELIPLIDSFSCSLEDRLHTLVIHIATQINRVLDKQEFGSVLLSGGGVHNGFLLSIIERNSKVRFIVPPKEVIDFKEALIFAWLGWCRIHGINNVLASATGARVDHCSGVVYNRPE